MKRPPSMYARRRATIEQAKQLALTSPGMVNVPGRFAVTAQARPVPVSRPPLVAAPAAGFRLPPVMKMPPARRK